MNLYTYYARRESYSSLDFEHIPIIFIDFLEIELM